MKNQLTARIFSFFVIFSMLFSALGMPNIVARADGISYIGDIGSGKWTDSGSYPATVDCAFTVTNNVIAGDDIIVAFTTDPSQQQTITVTDTQSNKYQQVTWSVGSGSNRTYLFAAYNVSALTTSDTITIHQTVTYTSAWPANKAAVASVFRGLAPEGALEQTNASSGSSATPSSGTVATIKADQLLIGAVGTKGGVSDAAGTWSNSFTAGPRDGTAGTSGETVSLGWRIVSSAGSYTAAKTGMVNKAWTAVIATFKTTTAGSISYIGNIGKNSDKSSSLSTLAITTTESVTAGDDILVEVGSNTGGATSVAVSSVTDSAGNSYSQAVDYNSTTSPYVRESVWGAYGVNALPSGSTITITYASGVTARTAVVNVFRGLDPNPVDKTASARGTGTAPSSGATATLSQADELLLGAIGIGGPDYDPPGLWGNAFTPGLRLGTGVYNTGGTSDITIYSGWKIVSSTAAATASTTLNTSRYWAASVATFKMASGPTHNLTVAVDPVGAGTTSPAVGINPYTEGSVVPVTIATTTSGYIFDHWSGDCSGSTCSVTMSADKSVTANFILAHTLTMAVSPSAGGTTTPTVGAHAYAVGAVVPISATAAANYHFVNWTGDADCTDGSVTLDAEKTCTANFALDQKTLTFTAGTGGTITAPAGSSPQIYDYGTVVTITAAANPGYHFTNWSGDVGTVLNVNAASTTITMNENYSITANFAVGELATLDGAVVYGTTFTGNSINLSVSTGSGQNQLMLVGVSYNSSTTGSAGSRPYISSVIFTPTVGDPITLDLVKQQWSPSTETVDPGRMAAIYILDPSKNPAAGTAGVLAVNFSASFTTGAVVGVANFKGVDQTDPLGTPNSAATGNSVATVSVDVTTTGNELVFDNFWAGGQSTTPQWTISANASQTGLWNNPLIGNTEGGASTKAASASTTTMNWTRSNNGYMALVAVPINPAPGVTMDFGDAPDPTYATLLANNGARHVIVTGYRLGATVDAEADGLPSTLADGDDLNNTDDEDGVSLPASIDG